MPQERSQSATQPSMHYLLQHTPSTASCVFSCVFRFLLLWSAVLIMYPTSLAVIALTFSNYVLQPVFPNCIPPYNASRILSMVCLREYLLLAHTQSLPRFCMGPLEGPPQPGWGHGHNPKGKQGGPRTGAGYSVPSHLPTPGTAGRSRAQQRPNPSGSWGKGRLVSLWDGAVLCSLQSHGRPAWVTHQHG